MRWAGSSDKLSAWPFRGSTWGLGTETSLRQDGR
jgi:hypothetical protein